MENYKLPERLVTVLKTAHVTQKQLGDMLGIDRTAVVKYCNGERIPSSLQLLKIANYLNVSCDWLLGNDKISYNDMNYDKLLINRNNALLQQLIDILEDLKE